jgi:TonB family protein
VARILELSMTNSYLRLIHSAALVAAFTLLLGGTALLAQDPPQNSSEVVYGQFDPGITRAKATYQPNPEYSDRAARKKIQGDVRLSIVVTAEGTVRDPQVTRSLDKDLDRNAVECVKKWKFEPAIKDGKPVATHVAVEVSFHMQ